MACNRKTEPWQETLKSTDGSGLRDALDVVNGGSF
jgi:hypothetical protein